MRRNWTALAVLAVVGLMAGAVHAGQFELAHVAVIDLGPYFNSTTTYGDNPLSVGFDGTNAYVGGYTNIQGGNVGVVKVENVTGTPTITPLDGTVFAARQWTGINAVDVGNNELYIGYNSFNGGGEGFYSFVRKADVMGNVGWTYLTPNDERVSAMAWDAVGKGSGAAVGYVVYGSSYVRYVGPDGAGQGNGTSLWTNDSGANTAHNDIDIDSTGNFAQQTNAYLSYGLRTGPTALKHLDGTTAGPEIVIRKTGHYLGFGCNVAIMEDMYPDGPFADLLAVTARDCQAFEDKFNQFSPTDDTAVHIRNLDGSTTGLTQLALTGDEGGLGTAWTSDVKDLMWGLDATGLPTLLVLDFAERRLDVYQVPEPGALGLLLVGGLMLLRRR